MIMFHYFKKSIIKEVLNLVILLFFTHHLHICANISFRLQQRLLIIIFLFNLLTNALITLYSLLII